MSVLVGFVGCVSGASGRGDFCDVMECTGWLGFLGAVGTGWKLIWGVFRVFVSILVFVCCVGRYFILFFIRSIA